MRQWKKADSRWKQVRKLQNFVQIGDYVMIHTPAGDTEFVVSGFGSDDKDYYRGQTYMVAVYMTKDAFHRIMAANEITEHPSCYVQFGDAKYASEAVSDIREQYGLSDGQVAENTAVMGLSGKSGNQSVQNMYGIASALFAMVLLAGVLMISGSTEVMPVKSRVIRRRNKKIEKTLGVHHAMGSRKNWVLMASSFALVIILTLCFSVGMDFAKGLMPSLKSWQPDLMLNGYANALVLEQSVKEEIEGLPGVKCVFGTSYLENVAADSSREGIDHVNLESYDDVLMESVKDDVAEGNLSDIYGDSGKVMTVYSKDNPLKTGDTVRIGETGLTMIGVQLGEDAG